MLYTDDLNKEQRIKVRSELKSLDLEYRDVVRKIKYLEKTRPIAQVY
jgi:hypothetical protein